MISSMSFWRQCLRCGRNLRRLGSGGCLAAAISLAACSNEPAEKSSSGHSDAQWLPDPSISPGSVIATHTYTCDNTRVIAVQYLGDGLSLLLHRPAQPQAVRLRAPRQGALFYGPGVVLKLHGQALTLREDGISRLCVRD